MNNRLRYPLLACALATAFIAGQSAHARPAAPGSSSVVQAPTPVRVLSEAEKIQALIASVEKLPGAVFIRNGTEHDAVKAAEHLRRKLGYAGKRVQTAEQFIQHLATGSSMTGKPYRIRFADGHSVESAAYFREQLRRLEAPARKTARG